MKTKASMMLEESLVRRATVAIAVCAMALCLLWGCSPQGRSAESSEKGASLAAASSLESGSSSVGIVGDSANAQGTVLSRSAASEQDAPVEPDANAAAHALQMSIDGAPVEVAWEDNASVAALAGLAADAPLKVQMSPHGGFEQYGPLGADLPSDDVQTVAGPGDVMLYSSDQIVVFYGSNSWAYTRLGRITDKSADELAAMLGGDAATLTIEVAR